jgi:predicted small lipoprotein YifL
MNMNMKSLMLATLAGMMTIGLVACEKKGPVERAGEEVDEAVDTMKNGGKESTANKLDDAADDVRDGVKDAAGELKKD